MSGSICLLVAHAVIKVSENTATTHLRSNCQLNGHAVPILIFSRPPSLSFRLRNGAAKGGAGASEGLARLAMRCLSAFTEQKQGAANFDAVAAFQRVTSLHRLLVHQDPGAGGRADEESLALIANNRMARQH